MPSMIQRSWNKWLQCLPLLNQFKIRRCLKSPHLGQEKCVEIHHFADASEKRYGTASYLRLVDVSGRIECVFLGSKSRLPPIKSVTIPRLELSAAALAVKINHSIVRALKISVDRVFFWTDSTAVLKYSKNVSSRFHVFVANRIAVIHDGSKPEQWRYVRSSENPADYVSRGQDGASFVKNSQWIDGPQFLWKTKCIETKELNDISIPEDDPEVKQVTAAACQIQAEPSYDSHPMRKLINYYSTWRKLTRAVACLLRFRTFVDKSNFSLTLG